MSVLEITADGRLLTWRLKAGSIGHWRFSRRLWTKCHVDGVGGFSAYITCSDDLLNSKYYHYIGKLDIDGTIIMYTRLSGPTCCNTSCN